MNRKPLPTILVPMFVAILICHQSVMAQEPTVPRTIGKIVRFDDRADGLISPTAEIELLASGFEWSEGPLWVQDADGGHLLFSDIPRNSVMKWKQGEGISLFMRPSDSYRQTHVQLRLGR